MARTFHRVVAGTLFSAAAILLDRSVVAQTRQQLNWCLGKDGATPDLIISACTAVIQSRRFTGPNLAITFHNRGKAYHDKGEIDRAMEDYNEAIRIDSNDAVAVNNRGTIYREKGETDRAMRDFDQATQLDPYLAGPYFNRGLVYFARGEFPRAIFEFDATLKMQRTYPGALYGRGVAKLRKGERSAGNADIAAANAIEADIGEKMAEFGVKP